jgi:hypothetical protein
MICAAGSALSLPRKRERGEEGALATGTEIVEAAAGPLPNPPPQAGEGVVTPWCKRAPRNDRVI